MARILLVDDEETVRGFLKRGLEIDGHAVVTANDGSDGLDRLNEADGGFDLMLTDIRKPLMDGIALALAAKARLPGPDHPADDGFADQRERARGLDAIVTDVLTKPFSLATCAHTCGGRSPPEAAPRVDRRFTASGPLNIRFRLRFTKAWQFRPANSISRDRYRDGPSRQGRRRRGLGRRLGCAAAARRSLFGRGIGLVKLAVFALPVAMLLYGRLRRCKRAPRRRELARPRRRGRLRAAR